MMSIIVLAIRRRMGIKRIMEIIKVIGLLQLITLSLFISPIPVSSFFVHQLKQQHQQQHHHHHFHHHHQLLYSSNSIVSPNYMYNYHKHMTKYSFAPTTSTSFRSSTWTSITSTTTALSMALIPLNVNEIEQLISTGKPTPQQYQSYFGRTAVERYNRILEGCIVALIGGCMSYFLSFVLGSFVATILGTMSILWGILSPELKAYQRNWEFIGGRKLIDDSTYGNDNNSGGLYGALWIGYVDDVCVVEDVSSNKEYDLSEFGDYTMENDELDQYTGQPYLIRLKLREKRMYDGDDNPDNDDDYLEESDESRELQIHARMSEEYLNIRLGMAATVLLLSTNIDFITLAALTDVYVADVLASDNDDDYDDNCGGEAVLVGDYPYLNRAGLEELLSSEPDLWNILISQQQQQKQGMDRSNNYNSHQYNEKNYVSSNGNKNGSTSKNNNNDYDEYSEEYDNEFETSSFQNVDDDETTVPVRSKRKRKIQR